MQIILTKVNGNWCITDGVRHSGYHEDGDLCDDEALYAVAAMLLGKAERVPYLRTQQEWIDEGVARRDRISKLSEPPSDTVIDPSFQG